MNNEKFIGIILMEKKDCRSTNKGISKGKKIKLDINDIHIH